MSVTEKTLIGTVDLTPSWEEILPGLLAVLQDGNSLGRNLAKVQLYRMAKVADQYVELTKKAQSGG